MEQRLVNQTQQTILEFDGDSMKRILELFNQKFLTIGTFVEGQRNVSPKLMSSLLMASGAGGTAIASKTSATLYMATANPATLMHLKSGGISTGVMGAKGIVEHRGFLPISSALPVVAPLMVMQTLSTIKTMHQLIAIDEKIDKVKAAIDSMTARVEAKEISELFATVSFIDEIYLQYNQSGCFSTDMLVRLALAERDAMIHSRKYMILKDLKNIEFNKNDTYCAMLASFLNLRAKHLRICVDTQENPQFVSKSSENFKNLLRECLDLWSNLLNKSSSLKKEIKLLKEQVDKANPLTKRTKDNELKRIKDKHLEALELEKELQNDFYPLIDIIKNILNTTPKQEELPTLVYWNDESGEHCISTQKSVEELTTITA